MMMVNWLNRFFSFHCLYKKTRNWLLLICNVFASLSKSFQLYVGSTKVNDLLSCTVWFFVKRGYIYTSYVEYAEKIKKERGEGYVVFIFL